MLAAGTPIAATLLLIGLTLWLRSPTVAAIPPVIAPLLANRPAVAAIVVPDARRLRRVPQLAACEPFHFRVGVFFPDALERRQQVLAR